jgi:hypothetical protein
MAACTACYDAKQQAASSRCTAAGSSSSAHGCGLGVLRNYATVIRAAINAVSASYGTFSNHFRPI